MDALISQVNSYFGAERKQAIVGFVLCACFLLIAYIAYNTRTPFSVGFAYPFICIIPILLFIFGFVYTRAPKDIARITHYIKEDHKGLTDDEIPRMKKVVRDFNIYRGGEALMIVGGAYLLMHALSPYWQGAGSAFIKLGMIFFVFDCIADMRAKRYLKVLQGFLASSTPIR